MILRSTLCRVAFNWSNSPNVKGRDHYYNYFGNHLFVRNSLGPIRTELSRPEKSHYSGYERIAKKVKQTEAFAGCRLYCHNSKYLYRQKAMIFSDDAQTNCIPELLVPGRRSKQLKILSRWGLERNNSVLNWRN